MTKVKRKSELTADQINDLKELRALITSDFHQTQNIPTSRLRAAFESAVLRYKIRIVLHKLLGEEGRTLRLDRAVRAVANLATEKDHPHEITMLTDNLQTYSRAYEGIEERSEKEKAGWLRRISIYRDAKTPYNVAAIFTEFLFLQKKRIAEYAHKLKY